MASIGKRGFGDIVAAADTFRRSSPYNDRRYSGLMEIKREDFRVIRCVMLEFVLSSDDARRGALFCPGVCKANA